MKRLKSCKSVVSRKVSNVWSFKILTVSGIPIRLHITFLLFFGWVIIATESSPESSKLLGILATTFVCIVFHELGHALVAKRLGVGTNDITLYPIGGVASLKDRPPAKKELWIAIAGPMVNVLIAIFVGIGLLISGNKIPAFTLDITKLDYWQAILMINCILPAFNMIPAFPMDGGRILRAILGMSMPDEKATRIAATIGQLLATVLFVVGLYFMNFPLLLISFFVFVGAGQEVSTSVVFSLVSGKKVSDAMITEYQTLGHGETVAVAAQMLLSGYQHDFPVVYGDEVIGVLTRDGIIKGLTIGGPDSYVTDQINREFRSCNPDESLEEIAKQLSSDREPIFVMENGKLLGLVTSENLTEFVLLEQAKRHEHKG